MKFFFENHTSLWLPCKIFFAPETPLLLYYYYYKHYHYYCYCAWLGDCVIAAGERRQIPTAVPSAWPCCRHPDWEYSVSQVALLPQPADGNNLTLCFKNFSPELIYWCMPARFFSHFPPPHRLNWSAYFPSESQDGSPVCPVFPLA